MEKSTNQIDRKSVREQIIIREKIQVKSARVKSHEMVKINF